MIDNLAEYGLSYKSITFNYMLFLLKAVILLSK